MSDDYAKTLPIDFIARSVLFIERGLIQMKNKITTPVITSHLYYALPLSIICSEDRIKPWIYSEFIQIHTYRGREDERMHVSLFNNKNDRFRYEPLYTFLSHNKQLVGGNDVVCVFKSLLNDGQYIYDFVDHFYIRSFGCNEHFIHDILIYGYDDNLRVFHAYSYHGAKLVAFGIPYSEYEAAYNSDYQKEKSHLTLLYRKKDERFYPNIRRIGNHLLDYLDGINTYNRESPLSVNLYKPKFGLAVYDELKYNLKYMRDWNLKIDIPDMYCVYDHKKFMHERVVYLDEHTDVKCSDNLKNKFAEIEKAGRIMIILVMKLNEKGLSSETDYNYLMCRFDSMKELEKEAFTKYYEYNRSVFENL